MRCHLISHFLIISRKPIGTVLESSCLQAGTDIIGLVLILMISDQCTYACLHHNTPFYACISHILTFVRFPVFFYDWRVASQSNSPITVNLNLCEIVQFRKLAICFQGSKTHSDSLLKWYFSHFLEISYFCQISVYGERFTMSLTLLISFFFTLKLQKDINI